MKPNFEKIKKNEKMRNEEMKKENLPFEQILQSKVLHLKIRDTNGNKMELEWQLLAPQLLRHLGTLWDFLHQQQKNQPQKDYVKF